MNFNIFYDKFTGEILCYNESNFPSKEDFPKDSKLLQLSEYIKTDNKVVNIFTKQLVKMPEMLLRIGRTKALAQAASTAPNGNIVELGVYQGGSALFLAAIARKNRELHLFDTFCGIPNGTKEDGEDWGDFSDCNVEKVKELIPDAHYHIGKFPDTFKDVKLGNIAFIHADGDLYHSMKCIKTHLWNSIVEGGMIYIDDYNELEGVKKAIDEDYPNATYDSSTQMMKVVKNV